MYIHTVCVQLHGAYNNALECGITKFVVHVPMLNILM